MATVTTTTTTTTPVSGISIDRGYISSRYGKYNLTLLVNIVSCKDLLFTKILTKKHFSLGSQFDLFHLCCGTVKFNIHPFSRMVLLCMCLRVLVLSDRHITWGLSITESSGSHCPILPWSKLNDQPSNIVSICLIHLLNRV